MWFFWDKHPLSQSTRTLSLFTCTLKHFLGQPWMQCYKRQHLLQNLQNVILLWIGLVLRPLYQLWEYENFFVLFSSIHFFCGTISKLRSKGYGYRSIALHTYWHKLIYNKILCYVEFANHIWYTTGLLTVSLVFVDSLSWDHTIVQLQARKSCNILSYNRCMWLMKVP